MSQSELSGPCLPPQPLEDKEKAKTKNKLVIAFSWSPKAGAPCGDKCVCIEKNMLRLLEKTCHRGICDGCCGDHSGWYERGHVPEARCWRRPMHGPSCVPVKSVFEECRKKLNGSGSETLPCDKFEGAAANHPIASPFG